MSHPAASPFRPFSSSAVICLLLAAATFAVYFPVSHYGFVNYDDGVYFFANPHVLDGLTWANIKWAFTTGDTGNWHPLTWLSLMLDAQLFGHGAAAPHLDSVLLHVANSILVLLLFLRLTGAIWRSAIVALLFAIHPMHVESVAWVSERKDVLSAFFGLLTLLCYANYAQSNTPQAKRPVEHSTFNIQHSTFCYCLSLFLFACGLMSKPMLVTLPFVMLLLDFWPLQRLNASLFPRLLVEKIPFFLLSAIASVVTFIVQQKGGALSSLVWVPLASRIENAFVAWAHYLIRIFWPFDLATPYPHALHWPGSVVIFSATLFAALTAAAVAARKNFPFLFTGWFWYAGMLVPVIGLVQIGMPAMADRYVYLPLVSILVIVVWGTAEICARYRLSRGAIIFCAAFLCLACAVRAANQVRVWKNDETLFGHALAVTTNNYIAGIQLATWYSQNGRVPEALKCYDDAMRMSSNDLTVAWYSKNDRMQAALAYYFNSLRINTNDPTELFNLGNASAKIGHWDEAIRDYRRALQITPDQPDILDNLGLALAQNKQLPEAAACFQAALKLQPDSINAHNNLAAVLYAQGNYQQAAQETSAALQLAPNDALISANLAGIYFRMGQTNLAIKYYQQALQLQPGNPQIRTQLHALGASPSN